MRVHASIHPPLFPPCHLPLTCIMHVQTHSNKKSILVKHWDTKRLCFLGPCSNTDFGGGGVEFWWLYSLACFYVASASVFKLPSIWALSSLWWHLYMRFLEQKHINQSFVICKTRFYFLFGYFIFFSLPLPYLFVLLTFVPLIIYFMYLKGIKVQGKNLAVITF